MFGKILGLLLIATGVGVLFTSGEKPVDKKPEPKPVEPVAPQPILIPGLPRVAEQPAPKPAAADPIVAPITAAKE